MGVHLHHAKCRSRTAAGESESSGYAGAESDESAGTGQSNAWDSCDGYYAAIGTWAASIRLRKRDQTPVPKAPHRAAMRQHAGYAVRIRARMLTHGGSESLLADRDRRQIHFSQLDIDRGNILRVHGRPLREQHVEGLAECSDRCGGLRGWGLIGLFENL